MNRAVGYSGYEVLLNAFIDLIRQALGDRMVSVVLYGSVARGTARADSDLDLLLILREPPLVIGGGSSRFCLF